MQEYQGELYQYQDLIDKQQKKHPRFACSTLSTNRKSITSHRSKVGHYFNRKSQRQAKNSHHNMQNAAAWKPQTDKESSGSNTSALIASESRQQISRELGIIFLYDL